MFSSSQPSVSKRYISYEATAEFYSQITEKLLQLEKTYIGIIIEKENQDKMIKILESESINQHSYNHLKYFDTATAQVVIVENKIKDTVDLYAVIGDWDLGETLAKFKLSVGKLKISTPSFSNDFHLNEKKIETVYSDLKKGKKFQTNQTLEVQMTPKHLRLIWERSGYEDKIFIAIPSNKDENFGVEFLTQDEKDELYAEMHKEARLRKEREKRKILLRRDEEDDDYDYEEQREQRSFAHDDDDNDKEMEDLRRRMEKAEIDEIKRTIGLLTNAYKSQESHHHALTTMIAELTTQTKVNRQQIDDELEAMKSQLSIQKSLSRSTDQSYSSLVSEKGGATSKVANKSPKERRENEFANSLDPIINKKNTEHTSSKDKKKESPKDKNKATADKETVAEFLTELLSPAKPDKSSSTDKSSSNDEWNEDFASPTLPQLKPRKDNEQRKEESQVDNVLVQGAEAVNKTAEGTEGERDKEKDKESPPANKADNKEEAAGKDDSTLEVDISEDGKDYKKGLSKSQFNEILTKRRNKLDGFIKSGLRANDLHKERILINWMKMLYLNNAHLERDKNLKKDLDEHIDNLNYQWKKMHPGWADRLPGYSISHTALLAAEEKVYEGLKNHYLRKFVNNDTEKVDGKPLNKIDDYSKEYVDGRWTIVLKRN